MKTSCKFWRKHHSADFSWLLGFQQGRIVTEMGAWGDASQNNRWIQSSYWTGLGNCKGTELAVWPLRPNAQATLPQVMQASLHLLPSLPTNPCHKANSNAAWISSFYAAFVPRHQVLAHSGDYHLFIYSIIKQARDISSWQLKSTFLNSSSCFVNTDHTSPIN